MLNSQLTGSTTSSTQRRPLTNVVHSLLLFVSFFTMSRPELQTPPELFYNDKMSKKYNSNSRMVGIQAEISDRCIELLNIPVRATEREREECTLFHVCVQFGG